MGNVCHSDERDMEVQDSYSFKGNALQKSAKEDSTAFGLRNQIGKIIINNFWIYFRKIKTNLHFNFSHRSLATPTNQMNTIANQSTVDSLPPFTPKQGNGESVNNIPLPDTIYKYSDESTYQGKLDEQGKRTGYGVSVTQQGDVYQGDWVGNKPHGNGRFVRFNGDYYQGEFSNGYPHGRGIAKEGKNSIMYEGEWKNGTKSGQGKETCPDGSYYEGKLVSNTFF